MSFFQPNGCSIRLRFVFVASSFNVGKKSLEELRQFRQIVRGVGIAPIDAFGNDDIFEREDFGYDWLWIRLWIFRVSVLCKHVKRFIFVLFLSAING